MQTLKQYPSRYLLNEAYSLLSRLQQVQPFSMTMPMVKGASVSEVSLKAVTELLEKGKSELRIKVHEFIDKIKLSQNDMWGYPSCSPSLPS